jgi:hypothetical protein
MVVGTLSGVKKKPAPANSVKAASYVNWEFNPPPGVRIVHMDGAGKVRFHIVDGQQPALLNALTQFISDKQIDYAEQCDAERDARRSEDTGEHPALTDGTIPPPR